MLNTNIGNLLIEDEVPSPNQGNTYFYPYYSNGVRKFTIFTKIKATNW